MSNLTIEQEEYLVKKELGHLRPLLILAEKLQSKGAIKDDK